MELKQPRKKDKDEALCALMDRCARAEVCISDAKRLMSRWGVEPQEQAGIIEKLIREKFIDERRYAEAFVRDKLTFSRWGARKITEALYQKRIPKTYIESAMEQADPDDLEKKLEHDLIRKRNNIKDDDLRKVKEKLLRFGVSRGYGYDVVVSVIERIIMSGDD